MPDNLNLNLNLDQNLNLNLGAPGASSLGPRYNTDDFCRLAPVPGPAALALPPPYPAAWDSEHRAWQFVHEFVVAIPWPAANSPVATIRAELIAQNFFPVPDPVAANPLNAGGLAAEILGVVNASIDRADRAGEIRDQASALGALSYWTGMLRINPATDINTVLLITVARKIGEFVAMGLKEHFRMRRPAHVYPWIMPLIDGPDTPSYPSSHSLQAFFISAALQLALAVPGPPPVWPPPPPWPAFVPPRPVLGAPPAATVQALNHLAYRIAYNREVAGVHYRMDSEAGKFAAFACIARLHAAAFPAFGGVLAPLFQALVLAAAGELANRP